VTSASDVETGHAGHRRPGAWIGYAACACAWLFAVPSFYWAGGGKIGADTIGRPAVESSWSTDPLVMTAVLVTALLKMLAGLLSHALVRPWDRHFPRWTMLTAGWGAAGLLTLYGGGQLTTQILIQAGTIQVPEDFDWHAFSWHLYLWSPGSSYGAPSWPRRPATTRSDRAGSPDPRHTNPTTTKTTSPTKPAHSNSSSTSEPACMVIDGGDPAGVDEGEVVAELFGFVHEVGDQQDRHALVADVADQCQVSRRASAGRAPPDNLHRSPTSSVLPSG
jgi:hypothetical protein